MHFGPLNLTFNEGVVILQTIFIPVALTSPRMYLLENEKYGVHTKLNMNSNFTMVAFGRPYWKTISQCRRQHFSVNSKIPTSMAHDNCTYLERINCENVTYLIH